MTSDSNIIWAIVFGLDNLSHRITMEMHNMLHIQSIHSETALQMDPKKNNCPDLVFKKIKGENA
jgi:hypothetical protein